jgi:prepilin-type N-terminal cleavage/methylation domain-containing protein
LTRRGGFTLLEVVVALVLTGLVSSIALAAVQAAYALDERLEEHRVGGEAQTIVRALLLDALRHPPEEGGAAMNDMLLELDDRVSASGLPADGVRFLSRGVTPPLGTSETWAVSLTTLDEGVRLRAAPVGVSATAPIEAWIGAANGLSVCVLYRVGDREWSDRWDVAGRVPAAVEVVFLTASGVPAFPPLVVHAGLEGMR